MDEVEKGLLAMLDDPDLPAHLRLGVLGRLEKLRSKNPPPTVPDGTPDLLAGLGLDEPPEADGLAPDPMRDLDFLHVTGQWPDPLFHAWTTVVGRD